MTSSSQSAFADTVRGLVEPAVTSTGLVLEGVSVTPAGRRRVLRITVDLPGHRLGGVPLDAVSQASQAVSKALDDSEVMGSAPYVLEVSSPGTDRPLTERRHWERARTRLVCATLADGTTVEGRVSAVADAGVTLGQRQLSWAQLVRGRVQVDFGAAGPLPDDDEDDVDDVGDGDDDEEGRS